MTSPAQRYAETSQKRTYLLTTQFSDTFDFHFDPFQVMACRAVESGKGVLVAAPTGAGKTVIGEFAAFMALERGRKCF
jgi:ATP-dependent RNA helicase HelY